jgi:hypothetical protein
VPPASRYRKVHPALEDVCLSDMSHGRRSDFERSTICAMLRSYAQCYETDYGGLARAPIVSARVTSFQVASQFSTSSLALSDPSP